MHAEYQILAILTLFFLFAWVPVSVGKMRAFGGKWLASNRTPIPGKELEPWAQRCERAYNNLKDYFPAFVVAVVILGLSGKFDESTRVACLVYLIGRLGHYVAYGMGIVPLRFVFFSGGLVANTYLLIKILI